MNKFEKNKNISKQCKLVFALFLVASEKDLGTAQRILQQFKFLLMFTFKQLPKKKDMQKRFKKHPQISGITLQRQSLCLQEFVVRLALLLRGYGVLLEKITALKKSSFHLIRSQLSVFYFVCLKLFANRLKPMQRFEIRVLIKQFQYVSHSLKMSSFMPFAQFGKTF